MRSPGRAGRHQPAPTDLDHRFDGGDPDRGPSLVQHDGGGSPLRLLPTDSWPTPQPDHAQRVPTRSPGGGRGRESSSTSGSAAGPLGGGDTVTRVWALSLLGTTEGRRLAGWSRGLGP